MQGLDLNNTNSPQESNYANGDAHNDNNTNGQMPEPPQDNNQLAAWYDTDL